DPDFTDEIPLCRPNLADDERLTADFESILRSGTVTKGNQLDQLEREIASFLGAEHVVLVSSCTTGLLLTMRCLGLTGEVVLPSFTFMASGHALRWNGLTPVFADIDPGTLTLSARDAAAATSGR
ncbi:DegT/DnrJ/EryC1/StrS family aminotransferase, partial [Streptomyces sp. IBSBF 2390]|uniref:DegT/DnrJ/EryC1/StrS family aminotransferase n=1 Tax=Streptomyces sp. IBSBF 2390 TaxID=2903533 RepID=UPI002FDBFCEC